MDLDPITLSRGHPSPPGNPSPPPGLLKELRKREQRKRELSGFLRELGASLSGSMLEIGCGHGHWLTAYAEAHPNQLCVGIDLLNRRVLKARAKAEKRKLANLWFVKADAVEFVESVPEGANIGQVMALFPDPWPKKRHHRRRLIQHEFLDLLAPRVRALGSLYFRTDHQPYFAHARETIEANKRWQLDPGQRWPMEHRTYFQDLMAEYQSLAACRNAAEAS